MTENAAWQLAVSIILPHPTRRQIIVMQAGEQPRLPQLQIVEDSFELFNQAVKRLWGLQTTVLRELTFAEEEASHRIIATYLLEWHNVEQPLPTGLYWLDMNELDRLTFLHPQQQEALASYRQEIESGIVPERRMAWAQAGWQTNTEAWIRSQLAQLGRPVNGAIEQIKTGDSCVLRAPTECGQVYFKVTNTNPLLVNEATFTQALGRLFPTCIPTPLCIDPERRWMLLPDLGQVIGWEAPIEVYVAVFRDFARLQIASSSKVAELLALDCIDRRLNQLAEQIDPFFAHVQVMALVTPEIQQQLLAAAPKLKALCAELDVCRVPATLVHGDLNMQNVTRCAAFDTALSSLDDDPANTSTPTGAYIFFDWTDTCISHPFLDMTGIFNGAGNAASQIQLRDQYLALWTAYEPMERLLTLWNMAAPLCRLHMAISYWQIMRSVEEACKPGWAETIKSLLGVMLEALPMENVKM